MQAAQSFTAMLSGRALPDNPATNNSSGLPPDLINTFFHHGVRIITELPPSYLNVERCSRDHILGDIVQCYQGHLLCRHCVHHEQYKQPNFPPGDLSDYRCPIDKDALFPDTNSTREIKFVYQSQCPSNTTYGNTGCPWRGSYNDIKGHLDRCENIPMKDRIRMLQHDISEDSRRIDQLVDEIKQLEWLLTKPQPSIQNRMASLDKGMELMKQQMQQITREFNEKLQALRTSPSTSLPPDFKQLYNNIESQTEENRLAIADIKNDITNALQLMSQLRDVDPATLRQVAGTLKVNALQDKTASWNGTLVWKIDGFAAKRMEAINCNPESIYSQPFCTSEFGYKMRARVYLNGDGSGKGTHISLFLALMKGDYDAIQRWPFRQKITFMILDQYGVDDKFDAFSPDPNSSSFQRPIKPSNIPCGNPQLLALSRLEHGYVKDDTMFIKIVVDTSQR